MSSLSPQWFDVLLVDINGICRGYQTPLAEYHSLLTKGLFWPYSLFSLRYDGAAVEETGIGLSSGDPDYPCQYVAGTHCPTRWRKGGEQAVFSLRTPDGNDFFADPQTALKAVLQKFQAEELSVVLAVELEFYLVDEAQAGAMSELYSFDKLARHRDFLDLIALSAAAQNIKTGAAISEYAPGQFEINTSHSDAPSACLNGVLFRRLVRECARATGRRATFMAKPVGGISGSGMHLHLSLVDKNGGFVFTDEDKLKSAVAGVLAVLPESMAFYAPYDNSYRRFVPGKYVPLSPSWGYENRSAAVRIPLANDDSAKRLEFRLPGADANPYLAATAILAGAHWGISQNLRPPPELSGEYRGDAQYPISWRGALDALSQAEILPRYISKDFIKNYLAVKESEWRHHRDHVSEYDITRYGAVI